MVFVEGDDYRRLRRPGDDPAQFRSVVRLAQGASVPDSVLHQYRGENFTTSTWTDSVGNADMSVNGLSPTQVNGAPGVSSDGVDDFGKTSAGLGAGPKTLPGLSDSFGVALTFSAPKGTRSTEFCGAEDLDTGSIFNIRDTDLVDGSFGEPRLRLNDGSNVLRHETNAVFTDSQLHLLVINKLSDTSVEMFVDDMTAVEPGTTTSRGFDHTNYNNTVDMAFFAKNRGFGPKNLKDMQSTFFEFNTQPYSSAERQNVKQRAPGV
jgi:hypothetical protein